MSKKKTDEVLNSNYSMTNPTGGSNPSSMNPANTRTTDGPVQPIAKQNITVPEKEEPQQKTVVVNPYANLDTYNGVVGAVANGSNIGTAARPTYTGAYDEQISQLLNDIYNRKEFNYDYNVDPLYQQYADQYSKNAREAMMNSMGQAAGLTGGYGNSYASQVGQQQYNEQMNQLQNVIPSLYSMAKDVYDTNNSLLNNKLATFNNQDSLDYSKYRDTNTDYESDRNYEYQKWRDNVSDEQYLTELYQAYPWLDPDYDKNKAKNKK